jgi:kojibiose phosphorylase
MKDYYSKYISQYSWLIKEEGWVKGLQGVRETQLALGNGFLGSRAVLEELPHEARPGTYIAGVYDSVGSQVAELVNFPNPFNFKITADGEKLGVMTMDVLGHKRILNLRHGLLCRHTVFCDTHKRRYDYQSMRFVSMSNKNIGVMQIVFTPLEAAVKISIETGIDTSVYNAGTVTEGRKRHFRVKELGQFNGEGYLIAETFGKADTVIFRSGFYYETNGKRTLAKDNIFELSLRKNQTVIFTKIFCLEHIAATGDLKKGKEVSERKFRRVFRSNFHYLLKQHIRAWETIWNTAEVCIWGDPEVEKNLRFNIYHMLICAVNDEGRSSIGAKALTGEGYRGHIFWDTEIFVFPFYLYTLPEVARNILLYRYRRLPAAREIARRYGFKGAMFPWESAGSGEEETPSRAKDLDGRIIRIHTGQQEHHITADIAYAFYHYYRLRQDEKFFRDYGYELLFETARFWASRVEYNRKKKKYEIKHVIGPDEFHPDVNNNAFTNMMAKWNLLIAYKMFRKIKKEDSRFYRSLAEKIGFCEREGRSWKTIATRICVNMNRQQLIEQFEGYFRKKRVRITGWDEHFLPVIREKISPRDYAKTQLVKQADVIMLLYLLSDVFSSKTKRRNYYYYIDRTIHKSSLSLPVHALMAIEVGDKTRAYQFFHTALRTDIRDINNNTKEGIHTACIGGVWQVLINGFAGVRIQRQILSVNPKLPPAWRKVLFSLYWKNSLFKFEVTNNKVNIRPIVSCGRRGRLKIKVFGILREIYGSKTFQFRRRKAAGKAQDYYL